MGDITISGAVLISAIGALCGVIVYLHKRSEEAHEREVNRLVDGYTTRLKEQADGYDERIKEVKELAFRATATTEQAVTALMRPLSKQ